MPPLLLRDKPLPRSIREKYLGVTLDHKLKWGEHVRLRSNLALGLLAQMGQSWALLEEFLQKSLPGL